MDLSKFLFHTTCTQYTGVWHPPFSCSPSWGSRRCQLLYLDSRGGQGTHSSLSTSQRSNGSFLAEGGSINEFDIFYLIIYLFNVCSNRHLYWTDWAVQAKILEYIPGKTFDLRIVDKSFSSWVSGASSSLSSLSKRLFWLSILVDAVKWPII